MVRFSIVSNRYIPVGHGRSVPFFEALYGKILDVDIDETAPAIEWDADEGHPVLIGDAQPKYSMTFKRAPNVIYDDILLQQQFSDRIPGLTDLFVEIKEGSAFLLLEDGTEQALEPGKYLPI